MTKQEKQTVKDALYCALVTALANADEKIEDLAKQALEIVDKLEAE